jgi:hypothetical protein
MILQEQEVVGWREQQQWGERRKANLLLKCIAKKYAANKI